MTSTAGPAHLPPLSAHARAEIGHQLQATLIQLLDLSLIGKQLHWSVTGAHFYSLHEQLDELVGTWRELADTVAERSIALGEWPDGQAAAISAANTLTPVERGAVADHMVIALLTHRLAEASESTRERMDRLGELDAASQDVLVGVVRTLEQQLWMIRSQTEPGHQH